MKQTFSILFAAMILLSAASCQKNEQPSVSGNAQNCVRTIELTFEDNDATKVGVSDDLIPQWQAGDKVWISNGTTSQEVTIAAADITSNVAKISTTIGGTLYAVYPASAQNGVSSGKIGFKIPTSTDGTFGNAHIAVAEGTTSLTFKNVVSILKITTEVATKLVNISSTSNVAGEFNVTYSTSTLAIENGITQANGINITSSAAGDKYVAVASGVAFNALEFTAIKTPTNWAYKKSTSTTTTTVNTIYSIGAVSDWTYTTNGSLWAKFSVADSKKVRFSKGNLYCNTNSTPVTYSFENNQYYFRHYNGKTKDQAYPYSQTPNYTVGSFFWVTNHETSINPYDNSYGTPSWTIYSNDVFFTNNNPLSAKPGFTANSVTGVWRTLSGGNNGEWTYLKDTRTGASSKVGFATVADVKGIILLPDSFIDPMKNNGNGAFVPKSTTGFNANVYTSGANWEAMESAGAVFLPAAGLRNSSGIDYVGGSGYYWSSNADSNASNGSCLYFHSTFINPQSSGSRDNGYSIRLVCAAQ